MTEKLHLSVSPHIHSGRTTTKIMLDVIIALLPTTIAGAVIFGLRALAVVAVCVLTCVLSEFLFNLIVKKEQTIVDLSAAVTGLLLALNLPATIPLWMAVIGSIFAIVVVKCIFGGIGKNMVNPAITARVFMIISFGAMTKSASPVLDVVSSATPLADLKLGIATDLKYLLIGDHGGTIGEVCAIAILIGGIYLLVRRVISWHIPVAFVGGAFVFSFLFSGFSLEHALIHVFSGGLLLGAFFMATDYVTSPSTGAGKIIFGLGAALITMLIRFWGAYPEGVSFAILLMNILTPYIDAWTPRRLFGGKKV